MKRKYYLFVILLSPFLLLAQSLSVLTHPDYLNNPQNYLSKISQSKIESNILIDQIFFDAIVMNVNGNSKVTTLSTPKWAKIYQTLKYASYDTTHFPSLQFLTNARNEIYQTENAYPIAIIDYRFNKIKQQALKSGQLKEESTYLKDYSANKTSFSSERVIATSCLNQSIYGDQVKFYIDDFFVFSNNTSQKLEKIDVDFGNGQGFQNVKLNTFINVDYSSSSEHINIVAQLTFMNLQTNQKEVLYSHSTVFRKGSNAVPNARISGKDGVIDSHFSGYYPKELYKTVDEKMCRPDGICYNTGEKTIKKDLANSKIQYHILYSDKNYQKLRKPFIVCDGFDPGNKRDYYNYNFDIQTSDLLPKQKDGRGLFELVNGKNSPWYEDESQVNLIDNLRDEGYDLVIVNFLDGAGDVIQNGEAFRGFLKNVINSSFLRNNKTEEAIVIGPSMGGLITRYALTTMEKANEEHYVKTWISFDSPHKGADIPLALQYLMEFGEDLSPSFKKGKEALHSEAAKQMLLSRNRVEFTDLYSKLDLLGFPKLSKNFAISNGGISKLYNEDGKEIIDLKVTLGSALDINTPWYILPTISLAKNKQIMNAKGFATKMNEDSKVLDVSKFNPKKANYESSKINQEAYSHENAPGGWHSGLYLVNYTKENIYKKHENDAVNNFYTSYTKATFISTASAFGIEPNQEKIHEIHTNFTANQTPFDEIHGMQTNEEHVKISVDTRDYLLDKLHQGFDFSQYPLVRQNQTVHEKIGGAVAYNGKEMIFGNSSNHTFSIQSTADININAESKIEFLPGFSVEKGAKLNAIIQPSINYSTVLRKEIVQRNEEVSFSDASPFIGRTYDYSNDQENPVLMDQKAIAYVSPNPFQENISITIQSKGSQISTNEKITVQFYDVIGNKVMEKELYSHELKNMNVSQLSNGVYFVHIIIPHYEMITTKIVKI